MKKKRIYLLPVILFSLLVVLRIALLVFGLLAVNRLGDSLYATELRKRLMSFETFLWPALLIIEIIIYCIIRKRIYNKLWVGLHSWITFAIFLLPIVIILFYNIIAEDYSPEEFAALSKRITQIRVILFYLFIVIAHIFFILTIVKSFKQQISINETPGLLDEFIS